MKRVHWKTNACSNRSKDLRTTDPAEVTCFRCADSWDVRRARTIARIAAFETAEPKKIASLQRLAAAILAREAAVADERSHLIAVLDADGLRWLYNAVMERARAAAREAAVT